MEINNMKRRISGIETGLGGGGKPIISGIPTKSKKRNELIKKCSKEVYNLFFKGTKLDYKYCDAGDEGYEIRIGIEPSYMYEPLKFITICEDKNLSSYVTGYSWGAWGTDNVTKVKRYIDGKTKSKFIRFIDKWHPLLFNLNK